MREAYIEQIATNVSVSTLAAIDAAAKKAGETRAGFVRRAVVRALKRLEKENF